MKFSHMHMNHFCPSDIQQVTITRNYTNKLTEIKVSIGMNLCLYSDTFKTAIFLGEICLQNVTYLSCRYLVQKTE